MTELTAQDKRIAAEYHYGMGVEGTESLYLLMRILSTKLYNADGKIIELEAKLAKVREAIE